jgi:hypothetical protein
VHIASTAFEAKRYAAMRCPRKSPHVVTEHEGAASAERLSGAESTRSFQ